jgi:hypothetical protein
MLGTVACSKYLMPEPSLDVGAQTEAVFETRDLTESFNTKGLDESTDVVVKFSKGGGEYAFDTAEEGWYQNANLLDEFYTPFGENYMAPWKLVPVGETDTVEATIAEGKADAEEIVLFGASFVTCAVTQSLFGHKLRFAETCAKRCDLFFA